MIVLSTSGDTGLNSKNKIVLLEARESRRAIIEYEFRLANLIYLEFRVADLDFEAGFSFRFLFGCATLCSLLGRFETMLLLSSSINCLD